MNAPDETLRVVLSENLGDPFRNFTNEYGHAVLLWWECKLERCGVILHRWMSDLDPSTFPLCRGYNYRLRRMEMRVRKRGRGDWSSFNDTSSSGRPPVPLLVVTKFVPRERMPLSMVYALPKMIFNQFTCLPAGQRSANQLADFCCEG
jgi:hypothetical protein